ncbi:DUF4065 domain-containing protein [Halomonas sp. 141]|uniref:Panacea domain-containing protein n=1 Tax=Halomonadaceae TaxID=28256 RepID=UPI00035F34C7|nr:MULTISPECIES: Panacea domain-containing protein [Halomonas]NGO88695.1 DUF4065 domain-containing protein [Halomonas sp.]PJX13197.1 DUF4065 domain-containing protein [Halomonas sp. 141]
MLNEEKVAQIAAYFTWRRGGQMSYLKLMKLMYLADRASMEKYDEPLSHDAWFSMDKGPVLSSVLELMQGGSRTGEWEKWIAEGSVRHEVALAQSDCTREAFDELSDADIELLDSVWNDYGSMTRWQLVDFTHEYCSEWVDPNKSARPIPPQDVYKALGKTPEEAEQLTAEIFQRRQLHAVMDRLR